MHRTIVISNKIDGVTELVKNNYNGYLIEKNNKDQYLKKIQYCENNKKMKKQMLDRSQKITLNMIEVYFYRVTLSFKRIG